MTKEEFHKRILSKTFKELLEGCDGFAVHCRYLYDNNNAKSLFVLTGIDFSEIFKDAKIKKDKL